MMTNYKVLILVLCVTLFVSIFIISLQNDIEIADCARASSKNNFRVLKLSTIGETNSGEVIVNDINGDGILDLVAGFQWFEGPHWILHQFARKEMGTKIDGGTTNTFDVDYDGDVDIVMERRRVDGGRELIWFENPGGFSEYIWNRHIISNTVSCVEAIEFVDIDYDAKVEMITVDDCREPGLLIYEIPTDPIQQWQKRIVCKSKLHGLGIGDLNADGHLDIVSDYNWFENNLDNWIRHTLPSPAKHFSIKNLIFRVKVAFLIVTNPGSPWIKKMKWAVKSLIAKNRDRMNMQTLIYDIDGDGDNDIFVTQAHTYGVYWLESSGGASPSFSLHKVLSAPSQLHGVAYGDIDNDGDIDIFTGKSRYSHGDPGENENLDVFWLELSRKANQIKWIKHELSSSLVMGFGPLVSDIDNDGDVDLVMRGLSFGNPPQFDLTIFRNQLAAN